MMGWMLRRAVWGFVLSLCVAWLALVYGGAQEVIVVRFADGRIQRFAIPGLWIISADWWSPLAQHPGQ